MGERPNQQYQSTEGKSRKIQIHWIYLTMGKIKLKVSERQRLSHLH